MKVRNGFVSNSSSSSFIIGIGIVENEDVFKNSCKDIGVEDRVTIMSLKDILETNNWSTPNYRTYPSPRLVIGSFLGTEVYVDVSNLSEDTLIAFMNTEGELTEDSDFMEGDDYWDMCYDRSPTDNDIVVMSVFDEGNGLKNPMTDAGAGRNG